MAKKVIDEHTPKPNNKLPFIAGGLLMLGAAWFVYQVNPGGSLRTETEHEKKERIEKEKEAAFHQKEKDKEKKKADDMQAKRDARKKT